MDDATKAALIDAMEDAIYAATDDKGRDLSLALDDCPTWALRIMLELALDAILDRLPTS